MRASLRCFRPSEDPDQSHFTSRHYYEVGALRANLRTGWLGRYLDAVGTADNPLQGLALDGRLAPALASERVPVAALSGAGEFNLWVSGVWGDVEKRLLEAIGPMGVAGTRSRDRSMREAGGVLFQAHRLRQQLRPFAGEDGEPDFASPVPYPEGDHDFPEKLAGVAAMLAYGLPLGCIALEGIARPLDIGVQGLMIPNVRTADQARRVVDCAKHPPVGNRSVGILYSDLFEGADLAATMERMNREQWIIAQIESVESLENADEIAAVPGIDVLWIGQGDLTTSMGIPGQLDHPNFHGAVDRLLAVCRLHGLPLAIMATSAEMGKAFVERGLRCIGFGDIWLFEQVLRRGFEELQGAEVPISD